MTLKNFWDKKIPTLLGIFLIAVAVGLTSYLAQIGVLPFLNAAPSETPTDIRITNISDFAFTVTYKTADSVIGTISYGTDKKLGQIALDDRDQKSGNPQNYNLHSITVRQLSASTTYYFSILSGKTTFLNNNQDFTVTTGPKVNRTPSDVPPVSGKIILPTGEIPTESLVFVKTAASQLLSTLTNSAGIYILPINTLRTSDLTDYAAITSGTAFYILANDNTYSSTALWSGDTSSPVPLLTLGNNYDFTASSTAIASTAALPIGFPQFNLDTSLNATPLVESPTDNESFSDQQPLFAGKALPNSTVEITIHSDQAIKTQVTSDKNGNWIYRPTTPLSPGQHTLTITTTNQNGILQTIEKTFTIFSSGTQVAQAATPSATPTSKPTPTLIPTVTVAPTNTPTLTSVPTPTLTLIPTTTNNTISSPTPTVATKLPPTGNNSSITIGIIGLLGTLAGIALFLASKGSAL